MATNVYFGQKVQSEQDLYEDIIIEALQMYGQDLYYIPRDIITEDQILNEDLESVFSTAYTIEMYIESVDGFEGEGNLFSKFGIQIRDNATFVVAKKRWRQLIGIKNNAVNSERPTEGDLLYYPLTKSLFEITFVEHESPFYQLSNLPTYKLQCELFEYGGETFDTGVDELDNIIRENITSEIRMVVDNGNAIEFQRGESISQEIGVSGEYVSGIVSDIQADGNERTILISNWTNTNGDDNQYETGENVQGQISGAIWNVKTVEFTGNPQEQNEDFTAEAPGIIEFDPSNPFGELD